MKFFSFSCCIALLTLTSNLGNYKPYNPRVNERVAAGFEHSLIIDGGHVWAWGNNLNSQIGTSENDYEISPVKINNLSNIIALAKGSAANHCLALNENGTVWSWGDNEYGQLGLGTNDVVNSNTPMMIEKIFGVVALSAGRSHSVALKDDGTVWTWGDNTYGQLGHINQEKSSIPKKIYGLQNVVSVEAGYNHSMALRKDGTVWTWGKNINGQLGIGNQKNTNKPIKVQGLENIVYISAGASHCLAIKNDGTVWSWGWNDYGQLGDGSFESKNRPVQAKIKNVVKVSSGGLHSVALTAEGTVFAWGANSFGQLGKSSNRNYAMPVKVFALKNITSVVAGDMHSIAIKGDGTVQTWGSNNNYQLGTEQGLSSSTPINIMSLENESLILFPELVMSAPSILPIENRYEPINEDLVERDVAFNSNGNVEKGPNAKPAKVVVEKPANEYGVPESFGLVEEDCPTEATLKALNLSVLCTEKSGKINLKWNAPDDILSLEFDVEKSLDNKNWISTDLKPALETRKKGFHFSVKDDILSGRPAYYRLKQMNCDGSFKYSAPAVINCIDDNDKEEKVIFLQPELSAYSFILYIDKKMEKGYKYEITDSYNRVVISNEIENCDYSQSLTISAKPLQDGLYLLKVINTKDNEVVFSKKLFKVSE
jgi:alpha-tubulin suppressor-like RCC1 family protein